MGQCSGCETLPMPIPSSGDLYLWPPLGHTTSKLKTWLHEVDQDFSEPVSHCVSVPISPFLLEQIRDQLPQLLSIAEQADCRCLILAPGETITIEHISKVLSLETLLGRLAGRWLMDIIAQRRLITLFQPIVCVDDPAEVFAHECLLRGQDTQQQLIPPNVLFDAARKSKTLFHLDRASRLKHIRSALEQQLDGHIFINFNPTSIYDPNFCLRSTVEAIGDSGIEPSQFVFEVVESDELSDPKRLPEILRFYRDAGFRVALDDVGAGFSSLNLLTQLKPDFVKLDMMLMRDIDQDNYKANIVSKLLEVSHNLGITTIVEGIETVGEWQWAREHGARYAQGYLFGKPSATPTLSCCRA